MRSFLEGCGVDALQDTEKSDTLYREGGRGLSLEARSDSIGDKWNCRLSCPKPPFVGSRSDREARGVLMGP